MYISIYIYIYIYRCIYIYTQYIDVLPLGRKEGTLQFRTLNNPGTLSPWKVTVQELLRDGHFS